MTPDLANTRILLEQLKKNLLFLLNSDDRHMQ